MRIRYNSENILSGYVFLTAFIEREYWNDQYLFCFKKVICLLFSGRQFFKNINHSINRNFALAKTFLLELATKL